MSANLWIIPAVIVLAVLVVVLVRWLARRLPPADRSRSFAADAYQPIFSAEQALSAEAEEARSIVDAALFEKIVLVTLVSIIFAQVLPDVQATTLQLAIGVAFVVTLNTCLSHVLARRGFDWKSALLQFVVMLIVNAALFLVFAILMPRFGGSISAGSALFFVLLLTLLVTLFDRYRQVYLMRFPVGRSAST